MRKTNNLMFQLSNFQFEAKIIRNQSMNNKINKEILKIDKGPYFQHLIIPILYFKLQTKNSRLNA